MRFQESGWGLILPFMLVTRGVSARFLAQLGNVTIEQSLNS